MECKGKFALIRKYLRLYAGPFVRDEINISPVCLRIRKYTSEFNLIQYTCLVYDTCLIISNKELKYSEFELNYIYDDAKFRERTLTRTIRRHET